jgi:hypothetical protein
MDRPITTVIPFNDLPACATRCGDLFNANGACVPPAAPVADDQTYNSCVCNFEALQPFRTGITNVCQGACNGTTTTALSAIQRWYTSLCTPATSATTSSNGATRDSNNGPPNSLSAPINTSTSSDNLDPASVRAISPAAIAGIVVGVVFFLGLIALGTFFLIRRRQRQDSSLDTIPSSDDRHSFLAKAELPGSILVGFQVQKAELEASTAPISVNTAPVELSANNTSPTTTEPISNSTNSEIPG